jgi:hypothetical protein
LALDPDTAGMNPAARWVELALECEQVAWTLFDFTFPIILNA